MHAVAPGPLRQLIGLLPELFGLINRLLGDARLPGRVRGVLGVAATFLASPIDFLPDFIPGLGYLDDVVLVAIVLDGLVSHVDRQLLLEHWPGDPATLDAAARVAARVSGWVPRRWKARVFGSQEP